MQKHSPDVARMPLKHFSDLFPFVFFGGGDVGGGFLFYSCNISVQGPMHSYLANIKGPTVHKTHQGSSVLIHSNIPVSENSFRNQT